jgi:very-short-patch-repair endonuclease
MNSTESSTFQNNALSLEQKLEKARAELLDLGARNRLLNIPRSKNTRFLEVIDERSELIYNLLFNEKKTFTFLHGKSGREENIEPEEESENEKSFIYQFDEESTETKSQHLDTKLQTRLTPKGLQTRLLDLYHDSKTLEEEQGANILFLALGTLKWVDPVNKENIRYAPLILVPVSLERGNAGERFKLKARQEDIIPNLSLEAFLDRVHHINLPVLQPGDNDEINVSGYFEAVQQAIVLKTDWEVKTNDIILGLFSFSKFLMYRDLDPANWPDDEAITSKYLIRALMEEGFDESDGLFSEDSPIDPIIMPKDMLHIMDSDSSQTLAIHEVRKGRNLVIQGPPGTGKSQTIANIIASAIADGKTVLFVAEKMAALEVVKRRLDQTGVGDACLELHSNKANKRILLEELKRVWDLGSPRGEFPDELIENLTEARDSLNAHPARLHKVYIPSGVSPYQVIGQLVRLRQNGQTPTDFSLHGFNEWSNNDLIKRLDLVKELIERIEDIGLPHNHPWNGVKREAILPGELDRLMPKITTLLHKVHDFQSTIVALAERTGITPAPVLFNEADRIVHIANLINQAPEFEEAALVNPVWSSSLNEIKSLIEQGATYQNNLEEIKHLLHDERFDTPLLEFRDELQTIPEDLLPDAFSAARALLPLLPQIQLTVASLTKELGTETLYRSSQEIKNLIELSIRVADAPNASPQAFVASVWEHGVEQARALVNSIADLHSLRQKIDPHVSETIWDTELTQIRHNLAIHTGMFKVLNSEWRRSRALARSLIRDTNQPIQQQIELLDNVIQAQVLRKNIANASEFGNSAFGSHWCGENSDSIALIALVEWMATLKDVGSEARLLASQLSDRETLRHLSHKLELILNQAGIELKQLWNAFGTTAESWFEDHYSIKRVPLGYVEALAQKLNRIDSTSHQVFKDPADRPGERLELVKKIIALQYQRKAIESQTELGSAAMGSTWKDIHSNWHKLVIDYAWMEKHGDLRFICATVNDRGELLNSANQLSAARVSIIDELENLANELESSTDEFFHLDNQHLRIDSVLSKLTSWIANAEQLSKWVSWQHRRNQANNLGLSDVVERLEDGRLPLSACYSSVEYTYYESLFSLMAKETPSLSRFDGDLHNRKVQYFAEMDLRRIKSSSIEVARAHHRRIPSKIGAAGPVGVLRAEMARKRGHMPIRQLMLKAGPAIQAIKPVMMMSPLSVAQFLIPGKQKFDLLVMDEASQIQPVDAIGAIARCQQVVVVGDERQLPPTSFFSRMTEASNDDGDDDSTQVADIESILGLFVARGLPQRMLRWHYRSRHQSLIAVSNSQFYENKLFIVPSPYTEEAGMGLRFHYVENGVFESGAGNANPIEAKRIATAILEHVQQNPELSLGVATFSVSQRKAIQDELEVLRRLNPQYEDFFNSHPGEPFFIKNLENIQGDERDVIMISVGYARNKQGYLAMRFGPLGSQGGERRLNVLISRAKRRCEVFASITDEDIDIERAKGVGVLAFKLFLQYARTGRLSMSTPSGRPMDSVFEEQVATALQARGYQVHPQVGIAGFFIDLAIADPELPGRYLLGIECDGSAYHSSRSARERDRLRQAVLEDHGWIIHRIWSTDWFQRPEEQLQRVINAIENAKSELNSRAEHKSGRSRAVPIDIVTVEREDVIEVGLDRTDSANDQSVNYEEAQPEANLAYALHETPIGILSDMVEKIVVTESPVHLNEVITRLRTAWGLQRAGARIESVVGHAAQIACKRGNIYEENGFFFHIGSEIRLRNRQNVLSAGLRKPELIAPKEIAVGALNIVRSSLGATEDEIVLAVSRTLGFKSTSSVLRRVITEVIEQQIKDKQLKQNDGLIVIEDPEDIQNAV